MCPSDRPTSRAMKTRYTALLNLAFLTALRPTSGHNWLVEPHAYVTQWATSNCQGSQCTAACPLILSPETMRNTPETPERVWQRGQTVRICYAKNNHHGGMARFSLVPIAVMNSRMYHSWFTLFHTCFDGGVVDCKSEGISCGTSKTSACCRNVIIPSVFPDGKYVLGHVWYGGLHFRRQWGKYADYYSCSFVEIRGGVGKTCNVRYTPVFSPGESDRIIDGECETSASEIGPCDKYGCEDTPSFFAKPSVFENGASPRSYSCEDLMWAAREHTMDERIMMGVCKEKVCCPKECGECGGPGCHRRAVQGCCVTPILQNTTRTCDKFDPPCLRV